MAANRFDVRGEAPAPRHRPASPASPRRVVVYGDFNCPWSYLVSRRTALLAAAGTDVDWRAVEHEPSQSSLSAEVRTWARFADLHEEMDEVLAALVPGETLPYCLAGFVPDTWAANLGFAEAYLAGVAAQVRPVLFEGFWLHAIDLADSEVVHTLLIDAVRCGSSPGERFGRWEYRADLIGGGASKAARQLTRTWLEEWRDIGDSTVPVIQVDDAAPLTGTDAVEWLGRAVLDLGIASSHSPSPLATR